LEIGLEFMLQHALLKANLKVELQTASAIFNVRWCRAAACTALFQSRVVANPRLDSTD